MDMNAVRDWLLNVWERAKKRWGEATKKAKIWFLVLCAGIIVLLGLFVSWITNVEYVLLASGLSAQEKAEIISILDEDGIEPLITNTGAIMVAEKDANRARAKILQRSTGDIGYELYQSLGMTATQADKNQMYIYQKQERARAMIESYEEVESAIVELSIPQPSIYALQGDSLPPTASITIKRRPGYTLSPEQIQGIVNIVKYSQSGLKDENIAISDELGDLKSQLNSPMTDAKLYLTEQVNMSVRNRILQGLLPVYGIDNISVAVNSVLDTDSRVTQETTYIPIDKENPQNNPLDLRERDLEKIGDSANAAQGVPGANDNIDIPQYSAEGLDVTGGESWRVHDVYDYLVSSVQSEIVKNGLEIKEMSVAVLVNNANLSEDDRIKLENWVSGATGLKVDNIKVQGMNFKSTVEALDRSAELKRLIIITGIALLALCLLLVIISLSVQKMNKKKREGVLEAEEAAEALALAELMAAEGVSYEPIRIAETQEQKLKAQIRDLALSDPEIVARLVKTWLVSD